MHERCVDALSRLRLPLLTTWPVFTESMYLLGELGGWTAQRALWRLVLSEELEVVDPPEPLGRVLDLMEKYRDRPMDLADATLVAVAEAHGLKRIFTLDADFRIYRYRGREAFEVVPD